MRAWLSFGEAVTRVVVDRGELTLHVRPDRVADVARHLRDDPDQRYEMLLGVSATAADGLVDTSAFVEAVMNS